jgi:flavodoxin/NAD-dependent dihydropyrimidine dehydrogenase PreA subunit
VAEKVAVVYFSQTGNTGKVACAVARGLERAGAQVELMRLEKTDPARLREYDVVGLGAPVFYFKLPFNVAWFIRSMHGMEGKFAFGFLTEGGHVGNAFLQMRKLLSKKGITLVDAFRCLGFDTYPPFVGKSRQLGHPNEHELAAAEAFGFGLLRRRDRIRSGEHGLIPVFERERGRFHRLSILLTRPVLFLVSPRKRISARKCTKCGICVKSCPTANIRLAPLPKFAWRCIYCYHCERVCPVRAIECDWTWMKKRVDRQYS